MEMIYILDLKKVKNDAHARFSALSRTYQYHISFVKNPFNHELEYYISTKLDLTAMKKATKILIKFKDFESFSKKVQMLIIFCEIYYDLIGQKLKMVYCLLLNQIDF